MQPEDRPRAALAIPGIPAFRHSGRASRPALPTRPLLYALIVAACLAAWPSAASAQGIANTLHELRLLVRPGETVTVADGTGTTVRGRIATLSPSEIVLETSGGKRAWSEGEVRTIRQRRGDPLSNGALIGLGVGAGLGLAAGLVIVDEGNEVGWVVMPTLIYGGLGAAIGVGIDALVTRELVIFEGKGGAPRTQCRITPLLTPRAQGVSVAVRF